MILMQCVMQCVRLALVLLLVGGWSEPASAQSLDQEFRFGDAGVTSVDFNRLTWSDLGRVNADGQIAADAAAGLKSRQWKAGDLLVGVLQLGDLPELGPGQFSVEQIAAIVPFDPDPVPLSQFPLLTSQPLSQLVKSVPYLKNFPIQDVAPLAALVDAVPSDTRTVATVAADSRWAERTLGDLGERLKSFTLGDLPNAAATPLQAFPGWQQQPFRAIPGLERVPLAQMPQPVSSGSLRVARIEAIDPNSVSLPTLTGSRQIGFRVPCPDRNTLVPQNCAGIVLAEVEGQKTSQTSLSGKQWVFGANQWVPGGNGSLQFLPAAFGLEPGFEPTGRHPFGPAFKQVLSLQGSTVQSSLVFRVCGFDACSPYNQFAVPFLRYSIGSSIVIQSGRGSDAPKSSAPPLLPDLPQTKGSYQTSNPNHCTGETAGGLSVSTLTNAIAAVDSDRSESTEVGLFVCRNRKCGRLLGQSGMSTLNEAVQSSIAAKPGGKDWLEKIAAGHQPQRAALLQYFPPELQTQILNDQTRMLLQTIQNQIDPQTTAPWQGERLIERVAQMAAGGSAAPMDSEVWIELTGMDLHQYGTEARLNYSAQGGGIGLHCGLGDLQSRSNQTPSERIAVALSEMGQFDVRSSPAKRQESAAWAVQQVLAQAGIRPLGEHPTYIPAVQAALQNGRGSLISPDEAQAGDLAIAAGGIHIGFCLEQGCQRVRSFSGSQLDWDSTADFDQKFAGSTLYRITQP